MRQYGFKRSSATLYVKRRRTTRNKKPSFFFRFIFSLLLLALVGIGVFLGGRYAWKVASQAQIKNWHIKTIAVTGIEGRPAQEILSALSPKQGQPFSMAQANQLQNQLAQAYPMLQEVQVSRGLLSGKLTVSARPRRPVARFILPDHSYKYLDSTSTIYADPHGPQDLLQIELVGEVPAKLPSSFVGWVQNILKLKKTLVFEALQVTVPENTITMRLADKSVIHFGTADQLKEKVARAVQIMASARSRYAAPFTLDFAYFNQGKVFLTHSSH